MDGRAASHTVTDKLKHLEDAGIEVVVLSGVSGDRDSKLEHHQLWSWSASGFRFELRHVLQKKWRKNLQYRLAMLAITMLLSPFIFSEKLLKPVESAWLWWLPAWRMARKLHRKKPFDLVYSSGGALAAHQAAWRLKSEFALPWFAEIHDPMVMPGATAVTRQEVLQAEVEKLICENADLAVWFTEQALASAMKRHPNLTPRGHAILPGVDAPAVSMLPYRPSDNLVMAHFGSLSSTRHLGQMISALEAFKERYPSEFQVFQLHIFGSALDDISKSALEGSSIVQQVVVHGRIEVNLESGESGREQILKLMRRADVLLLLHGHDAVCAEYIPSKTYEYLWMQRPVLAVVHQNPQMKKILEGLGHVAIDSQAPVGDFLSAFLTLYRKWQSSQGLMDLPYGHPYTTQAAVTRLLELVLPLIEKNE
jgi:hypothetical protein